MFHISDIILPTEGISHIIINYILSILLKWGSSIKWTLIIQYQLNIIVIHNIFQLVWLYLSKYSHLTSITIFHITIPMSAYSTKFHCIVILLCHSIAPVGKFIPSEFIFMIMMSQFEVLILLLKVNIKVSIGCCYDDGGCIQISKYILT